MMNVSGGFPDNSKFTPVQNALFGSLLEEIDDILILKCLLRIIWLYHQKTQRPKLITWDELLGDRTLKRIMSPNKGHDLPENICLSNTLSRLEDLDLIIHQVATAGDFTVDVYIPNTQEGRSAAKQLPEYDKNLITSTPSMPRVSHQTPTNIFVLYEQNIGIIGPIIAEELKEAESVYPFEWIQEAFRQAVIRNKRNWSYIRAILREWVAEGRKENGESGRHTKKLDSREWIRRHGLPKPLR